MDKALADQLLLAEHLQTVCNRGLLPSHARCQLLVALLPTSGCTELGETRSATACQKVRFRRLTDLVPARQYMLGLEADSLEKAAQEEQEGPPEAK